MQIRGRKPHSGERGGRRVSAMVLFVRKTENRNRYRDILQQNRYRLLKKPTKKTKTDTDLKTDTDTALVSSEPVYSIAVDHSTDSRPISILEGPRHAEVLDFTYHQLYNMSNKFQMDFGHFMLVSPACEFSYILQ